MQSVLLIGAEQVERAGHTISSAADRIQRAAGSFEESLHRQQVFMDEWLMRLEDVLKEDATRRQEGG